MFSSDFDFEDQVERAMMYALRECKDQPVQRNQVSTAMRNQCKDARHEAASRLVEREYVRTEIGKSKGRGRTPVMMVATDLGVMEFERLESKYMQIHKTIWG